MPPSTSPASLLETFLEELSERVAALEADLLAHERSSDATVRADLAASVFRSIHSLKGAAHAVGVPVVETYCHQLEDRLAHARSDGRLDPALLDALIVATDVLSDAGRQLREGAAPGAVVLLTPNIRLPAVNERSLPVVPVAVTSVAPPEASAAGEPTVQLRAELLDSFVSVSGEAVVARERLAVATSSLADLDSFVAAWRKAWPAERAALAAATNLGAEVSQTIDERLAALDTLVADRVGRISEAARDHTRVATALDGRLRQLRLQPFSVACVGLERIVRDAAHGLGREVHLELVGLELELDRAVLTRLRDPLRHLVRNAVDHGVEDASERVRLGKPAAATIVVTATLLGDRVQVTVQDDGPGINEDLVISHAAAQGREAPTDRAALARLLFSANFSTKAVASRLSGRGVGLDAVRTTVEAMLGRVRVEWTPGRGTTFTLTVPLSLATEHAVLIQAGGCTFALPTRDVRRAVRVHPGDLRSFDGRTTLLQGDGQPLPLHDLAAIMGLPVRDRVGTSLAIVAMWEDQESAFIVDTVLAARDVVVMSLGRRLHDLPLIVGATILGTGEIALLLDAARLVKAPDVSGDALRAFAVAATARPKLPRILAVDDSATTRSLLRSILETAGFEVATAVDGADAWAALQLRLPELIVSDVDMPRMSGFDLCAAVRDSPRLRGVPFVLVTSLAADRDRQRGMEVGADAYIVKGEFDQGTLLDTVRRLLA